MIKSLLTRILGPATLAVVILLALPLNSYAKDHKKHKHHHQNQSSQNQWNNSQGYNRWDNQWRYNQGYNKCNDQWRYNSNQNGCNNAAPSVIGLLLSFVNGNAGRGRY